MKITTGPDRYFAKQFAWICSEQEMPEPAIPMPEGASKNEEQLQAWLRMAYPMATVVASVDTGGSCIPNEKNK